MHQLPQVVCVLLWLGVSWIKMGHLGNGVASFYSLISRRELYRLPRHQISTVAGV